MADWKNDERLKLTLQNYVKQNLQRKEILDLVTRDFPDYKWSFRSLCRRLQFFGIRYIDHTTTVEEMKDVVKWELAGPGQKLVYRAMNQKLRNSQNIKVPRDLVYAVLTDLDDTGLKKRAVATKKKPLKGHFTSRGIDWTHSLDGHCKLMGCQRSTFPSCCLRMHWHG